jgi:acetyl esterase/lipase
MSEIICDIPYASQSSTQKLDVYLPDGVKGPCPVIVWLHPGGFSRGDKDMVTPFVSSILARGYAAVSVDYRLTGEAIFPAQIYDAKSAVRWVRANAAKYHFDPGKIASWGISAGSTLAALLGTAGNIKKLEDFSAGNSGESSAVKAVISWYGPMDFIALDSQRLQSDQKTSDEESSGQAHLMGGSISEVPETYKAASPITYVNAQCPPFYIQHGKSDKLVPCSQSTQFAEVLEAAIGKSKVHLKLIENAGHFSSIQHSPENIKAVLDFLDKYIK